MRLVPLNPQVAKEVRRRVWLTTLHLLADVRVA